MPEIDTIIGNFRVNYSSCLPTVYGELVSWMQLLCKFTSLNARGMQMLNAYNQQHECLLIIYSKQYLKHILVRIP